MKMEQNHLSPNGSSTAYESCDASHLKKRQNNSATSLGCAGDRGQGTQEAPDTVKTQVSSQYTLADTNIHLLPHHRLLDLGLKLKCLG